MAKEKKPPFVSEIESLRKENARYKGFIARLHGHLHLEGVTEQERFDAVSSWLSKEINEPF